MKYNQLFSKEMFNKKRSSILYHYRASNVHKINANKKSMDTDLIKSGLVMKCDIIYMIIKRAVSQNLIEEVIMIMVREKKRNNIDLIHPPFNVGDYLQGKNVTKTLLSIFHGIITKIERKVLFSCKSDANVVVIGGGIDSWSQKQIKKDLQCLKASNMKRVRIRVIGMKGFKYNKKEKVKSLKASIRAYADTLKKLEISPTHIDPTKDIEEYDEMIIFRNFCLDGAHFHEKIKKDKKQKPFQCQCKTGIWCNVMCIKLCVFYLFYTAKRLEMRKISDLQLDIDENWISDICGAEMDDENDTIWDCRHCMNGVCDLCYNERVLPLLQSVPIINKLVAECIVITPFYYEALWDPQHLKEISAGDSMQLFDFFNMTKKFIQRGINLMSYPKWWSLLLSLFEDQTIKRKPKRYQKESETRYTTHYTKVLSKID